MSIESSDGELLILKVDKNVMRSIRQQGGRKKEEAIIRERKKLLHT